MMKWLKYLLLAAILFGAGEQLFAQKIRFPTNVRYIAGGYMTAKRPYFSTLEAALNDVKSFATSDNPYVFWLDSDSLWISDWDSVFTESGLTMKDSIDAYYVAEGKIKWAGFGFGGTGGGGTTAISAPTGSTVHYDFWTWTGQSNLATWQTRIAMDIDSIDQRIWELIVYTDSVYLYVENDTLKFRSGSISVTGWNPDTTTVLRTTGNQAKSGSLTMTAGILFGVNGYLQLPSADYGPGSNIWRASNKMWYSTGTDTFQVAFIDPDTGLMEGDSTIAWSDLQDEVQDSINAWKTQGTAYASLNFDSTYTPDVTSGTPIYFAPGFTSDGNLATVAGDTVTISTGGAGDWILMFSTTCQVAATDDYELSFRINNVEVHTARFSGLGAAEYVTVSTMHYAEDVADGDDISIYIDNLNDNDDPNLLETNIFMYRIHL